MKNIFKRSAALILVLAVMFSLGSCAKRRRGGADSVTETSYQGLTVFTDAPTDALTEPQTEPETTASETTGAETTGPETTEPVTTEPETTAPETTKPETTAPETTKPETTRPETTAPVTTAPETTKAPETEPPKIDENGVFTSKDDVALYIHTYGKLPKNFITKSQAQKAGWEGGGLDSVKSLYGKCIGGDTFGNREKLLPTKSGRKYYECDIDTLHAKSRGAKRIVFSNDGLIYYTDDHYETFTKLY